MAALKEIIKQLIHEVEQMVDSGECDLNPDQIEEIALIVHEPKFVGREEAAKFLGVSLNRFYELRDQGIIPMPKKVRGQKEKLYSVYELRKCECRIRLEETQQNKHIHGH